MQTNQIIKRVLETALSGFVLSLIGVIIAYNLLPEDALSKSMCCDTGFSRKWDGTCGGWSEALATDFILGSLLHWYAYTTISIMIITRHPISTTDKGSAWTIYLTAAFVFGCGVTHLIAAYTALNPIYRFEVGYLIVNGIISVVAMLFVIYGLVRATANKDNLEDETD